MKNAKRSWGYIKTFTIKKAIFINAPIWTTVKWKTEVGICGSNSINLFPNSQLDSKKSIFTHTKEKFQRILLLIPNWNARHVLTYRLHHPKTHGHLQWLLKLYCCLQLTSNLFFTAMTFYCRHDRFLAYYSQGSSLIGPSLLLKKLQYH